VKAIRGIIAIDVAKHAQWQEYVRKFSWRNEMMLENVDLDVHEKALMQLSEECGYKIIVRDGSVRLVRT
jgi:hypothetical protein